MWEGISLFNPSWDDFIEAANGIDASLNLGNGEEILWFGKASGKYASFSYYPRQIWAVLGMATIVLVILACVVSTAPNIGRRAIYVYIILLSFFAIMSIFVYLYAYRYWFYIGRHDIYIITSKRVIFFISAGRWIFPWGGLLSDTILRRNAIAHNKSRTFSITIRKLNAVEVRKLPRVEVGNIFFPGWADDRRLTSPDYTCFLYDESAAAPSDSILINKTMLRIGPRHLFRPSGMYSIRQITRVGQLLDSLIRKSKDEV